MILEGLRKYFELGEIVVGINRRNQDFVRALNKESSKRIVDNKLLTKKYLIKKGLPVSKVFVVFKDEESVYNLRPESLPKSFVIKPRKGRRGQGIKVFYGKKKGAWKWIAADGVYSFEDIQKHIIRILTGQFSLGVRKYDHAFLEERLKVHPVFKPYVYKGIPDIRIIVYKGIPIMAMTRLPTRKSGGTANLHTGAITVGIDMRMGITTTAIQRRGINLLGDVYDIIETVPDKPYLTLSGIKIPYWKKVLLYASKAAIAVGLGYAGVDIAIDRELGPVILEVNARPGLGIQMANQAGLLERIMQVRKKKPKTPAAAVELAMTLFGGEVVEEVEAIIGKQVIGITENITLLVPPYVESYYKRLRKEKGKKIKLPKSVEVKAKVDTGAYLSSIDLSLARSLGFDLSYFDDLLKIRFSNVEEAKQGAKELEAKYVVKDAEGKVVFTPPHFLKGFFVIKNATGIMVRPRIKIPTKIGDDIYDITYTVGDRSFLNYPVLLGRKDLKEFLIDPSRKLIL